MDETVEPLCKHEINSDQRIANPEKTIQELRDQLADSQRAVKQAKDSLEETIRSLRAHLHSETSSADTLIQILSAHEERHRCEALFAQGHIIDAALSLLEFIGTLSVTVEADKVIMDWLSGFTKQCITGLERIGDEASSLKKHDEALRAYSIALSLGPPSPNILLVKWASKMMVDHPANDMLRDAAKFEVPRFDAYRVICDVLERDGRLEDAITCFRQLQHEVIVDTRNHEVIVDTHNHDERAEWKLGFQRRCMEKAETLGGAAMDVRNFDEVAETSTTPLPDRDDRMEDLVKRSKAHASMKSWGDALSDADEAIKLDPSSHRGYEIRYAALHGAKRHVEAAQAFDMMLSKLHESPDKDLYNRYVDARRTIRRIVDQTISRMPRVLIDTITGRLRDKRQQVEAFEALPIYTELVSSVATQGDYARIRGEVKEFFRYVMLSHLWDDNEPLLQKVERITVYKLEVSRANTKLQTFCSLARSLGFRWAWSDTCCLEKDNSVVLQESLVAMFRWFGGSSLTMIHLRGVWSKSQKPGGLRECVWNTRAWTYQEYVAAGTVQFYTEDWKPYLGLTLSNHKDSPQVISEMEQVSGVSSKELAVLRPGLERVREKLFIASSRRTSLEEDVAYSLLGIFNAAIPIMYGEGNRAVGRLLEHILAGSGDVTILAWTGVAGAYNSCLPMNLTVYNQLIPPHVPQLIETGELDRIVEGLRSSIPDLTLVTTLYSHLHNLPSPSGAATRLRLPAFVFRLTDLVQTSGPDPDSETQSRVYHATASTFGDIEIMTADDLTEATDYFLVHPWIRPLLDQEFSRGAAVDKTTQALRLVARLRQPFGALMLRQLSRVEHRRVAADCFIKVRLREEVSLTDLINNTRAIEVL